MGDREGRDEGDSLGERDGPFVGCFVSWLVWNSDGEGLGTWEGDFEGAFEGDSVGLLVG